MQSFEFNRPDEGFHQPATESVHEVRCTQLCEDLTSIAHNRHGECFVRDTHAHMSLNVPDRAIVLARRGVNILSCTIFRDQYDNLQYGFHGYCAETHTVLGCYVQEPTSTLLSALLARTHLGDEDVDRAICCFSQYSTVVNLHYQGA